MKNNIKESHDINDSTSWLNNLESFLDNDPDCGIMDIQFVNQGCPDMHYQVVFEDGETLSLERG